MRLRNTDCGFQVIAVEERLVRPCNESRQQILCNGFREESGLDEELIKASTISLENALHQVRHFLLMLFLYFIQDFDLFLEIYGIVLFFHSFKRTYGPTLTAP